ncbi:MAG TPA: 5-oxoprolinase subunit PxpB [Candidatus Udaeobacter sp.]|nr:5-oxoprolinase subunit PxpB [Candidatus Udaeobacter sp.]
MEIIPLGDSALVVRVREQFEDAPEETLDEVLRAFQLLQRAAIPGVIELAPAYTSVAIFFDPIAVSKTSSGRDDIFDWLKTRVCAALVGMRGDGSHSRRLRRKRAGASRRVRARVPLIRLRASRPVEIPVCYDSEFGFDLDRVAEHTQLSEREIVDIHTSGEYRVACIGFVPGFTFLAGLPKKLATPRRDAPRKEIPPGSVGIGGVQTGIYPLRSPGGWNLIGRTPLKLFDPSKNPPTLLQPGDRVRFRAITREEFIALGVDPPKTITRDSSLRSE